MVCNFLPIPVIAKEVAGVSEQVVRQLAGAGIVAIDVAGWRDILVSGRDALPKARARPDWQLHSVAGYTDRHRF
jgi:hypothetical protein